MKKIIIFLIFLMSSSCSVNTTFKHFIEVKQFDTLEKNIELAKNIMNNQSKFLDVIKNSIKDYDDNVLKDINLGAHWNDEASVTITLNMKNIKLLNSKDILLKNLENKINLLAQDYKNRNNILQQMLNFSSKFYSYKNTGNFNKAWKMINPRINEITKNDVINKINTDSEKCGKFVSKEILSYGFADKLTEKINGDFYWVTYKGSYEKIKSVVDTFTIQRDSSNQFKLIHWETAFYK